MAIRSFNSIGGFSIGETPVDIILANGDIATNNINVTSNVSTGSTLTNTILYANGQPYDFITDPGGNTTEVQFNDAGMFNGSVGFTYVKSSTTLTANNFVATSTADLGNVGNVTISGGSLGQYLITDGYGGVDWSTVSRLDNGNSNVVVYGNGNVTTSAGGNANVFVVTTFGTIVTGNANISGNANIGNVGTTNLVVSDNANIANLDVTGYANVVGNLSAGNINTLGNVDGNNINGSNIRGLIRPTNGSARNGIMFDQGSSIFDTASIKYYDTVGTGSELALTVTSDANDIIRLNASGGVVVDGNLSTGNIYANAGLISGGLVAGTLVTVSQPNITSLGTLSSLTVGNLTDTVVLGNGTIDATGNANVGNLETPGLITATGNITGGNLSTVGLANVGSLYVSGTSNLGPIGNVTITGGTTGQYLQTNGSGVLNWSTVNTSRIDNGNSNVSIPVANGNVDISVAGNANVVVITGTGINVAGTLNVTGNANVGNLGSFGIINAVGNISGANFTTTGQITATGNITSNGNVVTDYITSRTGNLVIETVAGDNSIYFIPTGNGTVDAGNARITSLATPNTATDAATKQYVDDSVSAGIHIHPPVLVETPTALNATYTQGGTTPTITAIATSNTLTTSTNHGLVIDDMIVFDSTTNGLIAGFPYFVFSTPALNQITLSNSYSGTQITTLTDGTSLTITSRANSGVNATLTNAGTQAALVIDNIALALGNRVLVYVQANAAHNGVYDVTNIGSISSNWELTRSTDQDEYEPRNTFGMGEGDYFFVQAGDTGKGESYVLTTIGVIIIGTTDVTYTQFSDSQVYNAGTGLALNGTIFSIANTLVTPNTYGNASYVPTFTVNQQGQLTAASSNIVISPAGTLTGDTLNSSVLYSNLTSVGSLTSLTVIGNLSAGNLNGAFANGNSNVNIPVVDGNINLSASGVANVVVVSSSGVNVAGNISGQYLSLSGNASVSGIKTDNYYYANGNPVDFQQPAGSNTQIQFNLDGDFGATSNLTFNSTTHLLNIVGNANVSNSLGIGNTRASWGTLTTTATTANQTIASLLVTGTGVTGLEFIVKGVDSTGAKYSMATVQAVTNGTIVEYSTFAGVNLGGTTGLLSVNVVVAGPDSNVSLQVTPSSSNSTVWTTQYRVI